MQFLKKKQESIFPAVGLKVKQMAEEILSKEVCKMVEMHIAA